MGGMLAVPRSALCRCLRCFELNVAPDLAVGGPNPVTPRVPFAGWRGRAHEGLRGVSSPPAMHVCVHVPVKVCWWTSG